MVLIAGLLPPGVHGAQLRGVGDERWLLGAERAAVEGAVRKRRREYAAARHAAREALSALGLGSAAVLSAPTRDPVWPDGVVGSLTHCDGYAAAAVARRTDAASVGIDAEPNRPLPADVGGMVMDETERRGLEATAPDCPDVALDRVLFCAKEATYKAWFPLTRRWLGFEDARVVVEPGGRFEVRLLLERRADEDPGLWSLSGRWGADADVVVAALVVPAGRSGPGA